jgi:hypothetical protein
MNPETLPLTDEAQKILAHPDNWSKEFMPDHCALCRKPLGESVPLILWTRDNKWAICFHMQCAFGGEIVAIDNMEDMP